MNSVEAYKGFITFLILGVIVALSVFGFGLVNKSSNNSSEAKDSYSEPKNIKVEINSETAVTISWETEIETDSKLIYSRFANLDKPQTSGNTNQKTRNHSVKIDNLETNTLYFYSIVQSDKKYPETGTPHSFTTSTATMVAPVIRESNESQIENQAEKEQPQVSEENTTQEEETPTEEFSGFGDAKPAELGETLGVNTYQYGNEIYKIFKEATIYQDTRYDFNGDNKVDTVDWPLFLNFILNQED